MFSSCVCFFPTLLGGVPINEEEEGKKLLEALKYDPETLFRGGKPIVDVNEVTSIINLFIKEGSVTLALSSTDVMTAHSSSTSSAMHIPTTFQQAIPFLQLRLMELRSKNIIMGDGSHVRVYFSLQDFEGYTVTPSAPSTSAKAKKSHHSVQHDLIYRKFLFRRNLKVISDGKTGDTDSVGSLSEKEGERYETRSMISSMFSSSRYRSGSMTGGGAGISAAAIAANLTPPLFSATIELAPENKDVEVAVNLELEELEFWISPKVKTIDQLTIFATWPADLAYWSEMEMTALNELADFKTRVNAKLEYMVNNHSNVLIEGKINAPVLIIYDTESRVTGTEKSNVLVIDLGIMHIHTEKLAKAKRQRDLEAMSAISLYSSSLQGDRINQLPLTPNTGEKRRYGRREINDGDEPNDATQDLDFLMGAIPVEDPLPLIDRSEDEDQMNQSNALARRSSIYHKYDKTLITSDQGDVTQHTPREDSERGRGRGYSEGTTGNDYYDYNFTEEELFDVFQSHISSIEVYLIEASITNDIDTGKWSVSYNEVEGKTVIIPSFEIETEIQVSVLPWDITLPPVKLFIDIPELQIQLSEQKILRLCQFVSELVTESTVLIESNIRQIKKMNDVFRRKNQIHNNQTTGFRTSWNRTSSSSMNGGGNGYSDRRPRTFSYGNDSSVGGGGKEGGTTSRRQSEAGIEFFDTKSEGGHSSTYAGDEKRTPSRHHRSYRDSLLSSGHSVTSKRSSTSKRSRNNARKSHRYSKSSGRSDFSSSDIHLSEQTKLKLKKLDEEGIQIHSDDGKPIREEDEEDDDDDDIDGDDDSFYSIEDDEETAQQLAENHQKQLEELKYVISQRESMRAKLITDIRLTEADITKASLHESLKQELAICEHDLHQLKISYVELLMNQNDYLQAFDDFDQEFDVNQKEKVGKDKEKREQQDESKEKLKEQIESILSTNLNSSTSEADRRLGHKRDLIHASVFKLSSQSSATEALKEKLEEEKEEAEEEKQRIRREREGGSSPSEGRFIDRGPSKEMVYLKILVSTVNIDIQYKEAVVTSYSSKNKESFNEATSPRSFKQNAFQQQQQQQFYREVYRFTLSGINTKVRHRTQDTSLSFHLRDCHFLDLKVNYDTNTLINPSASSMNKFLSLQSPASSSPHPPAISSSFNPLSASNSMKDGGNGSGNVFSLPFMTTDPSYYAMFATPMYSSRAFSGGNNSNNNEFIRLKHEIKFEHYLNEFLSSDGKGGVSSDYDDDERVKKVAIHSVKLNLGYLAFNFDQNKLKTLILFVHSLQKNIERTLPMNSSVKKSTSEPSTAHVRQPSSSSSTSSFASRPLPPLPQVKENEIINKAAVKASNEKDPLASASDSFKEGSPIEAVHKVFHNFPVIHASVKVNTISLSLLSGMSPVTNFTISATSFATSVVPDKLQVGCSIADISIYNLASSSKTSSSSSSSSVKGSDYNTNYGPYYSRMIHSDSNCLGSGNMIFGRHISDQQTPFLKSQLIVACLKKDLPLYSQKEETSEIVQFQFNNKIAHLGMVVDESFLLEIVKESVQLQETLTTIKAQTKDKVVFSEQLEDDISTTTPLKQLPSAGQKEKKDEKPHDNLRMISSILKSLKGKMVNQVGGFQLSYPFQYRSNNTGNSIGGSNRQSKALTLFTLPVIESLNLKFRAFDTYISCGFPSSPSSLKQLDYNSDINNSVVVKMHVVDLSLGFQNCSILDPLGISSSGRYSVSEKLLLASSDIPSSDVQGILSYFNELSKSEILQVVDIDSHVQPVKLRCNQSLILLFKEFSNNVQRFTKKLTKIKSKNERNPPDVSNPFDFTVQNQEKIELPLLPSNLSVTLNALVDEVSCFIQGDEVGGSVILRMMNLSTGGKCLPSSLRHEQPMVNLLFSVDSFAIEDVDNYDNTFYLISSGKFSDSSVLSKSFPAACNDFLFSQLSVSDKFAIDNHLTINDINVAFNPSSLIRILDIVTALTVSQQQATQSLAEDEWMSATGSLNSPRFFPDSPKRGNSVMEDEGSVHNSSVGNGLRGRSHNREEDAFGSHPSSVPMGSDNASSEDDEKERKKSEAADNTPLPLTLFILNNLFSFLKLPNTVTMRLDLGGTHLWLPVQAISCSSPACDSLRLSSSLTAVFAINNRASLSSLMEDDDVSTLQWFSCSVPSLILSVHMMEEFPNCFEASGRSHQSQVVEADSERKDDLHDNGFYVPDNDMFSPPSSVASHSASTLNKNVEKELGKTKVLKSAFALVHIEGSLLIFLQSDISYYQSSSQNTLEAASLSKNEDLFNELPDFNHVESSNWQLTCIPTINFHHTLHCHGEFSRFEIQLFLDYRPFLDLYNFSIQPILEKIQDYSKLSESVKLTEELEDSSSINRRHSRQKQRSRPISSTSSLPKNSSSDILTLDSFGKFVSSLKPLVEITANIRISQGFVQVLNNLYHHPLPILILSTSATEISFQQVIPKARRQYVLYLEKKFQGLKENAIQLISPLPYETPPPFQRDRVNEKLGWKSTQKSLYSARFKRNDSDSDLDLLAPDESALPPESQIHHCRVTSEKPVLCSETMFEDSMIIAVSLQVSVNYQNQKLIALEPLVEPVSISLNYRTFRPSLLSHDPIFSVLNQQCIEEYPESEELLISSYITAYLNKRTFVLQQFQQQLTAGVDDKNAKESDSSLPYYHYRPTLSPSSSPSEVLFIPSPSLTILIGKVNLNVTVPFLQVVFNTLKSVETLDNFISNMKSSAGGFTVAFSSSQHVLNSAHKKNSNIPLLTVRNESGVNIRYSLINISSSSAFSNSKSTKVLPSFCEEIVFFNSKSSFINMNDGDISLKKLQFSFQNKNDNYDNPHEVALDFIGCRVISVSSSSINDLSDSKKTLSSHVKKSSIDSVPCAVIDLSSKNGMKTLTIRSSMRLFNSTQTLYVIKLVQSQSTIEKSRKKDEILWESSVAAGKGVFVPLQYCSVTEDRFFSVSPQFSPPSSSPHSEGYRGTRKNNSSPASNPSFSAVFPCPKISSSLKNNLGEGKHAEEQETINMYKRKTCQKKGSVSSCSYHHWLKLSPSSPTTVSHSHGLMQLKNYYSSSFACNIEVDTKGRPAKKQQFISLDSCTLRNITIQSPLHVMNYLPHDINVVILPELEKDPYGFGNCGICLNDLFKMESSLLNIIPQFSLKSGQALDCSFIPASESCFISLQFAPWENRGTLGPLSSLPVKHWSSLAKILKCSPSSSENLSTTLELSVCNDCKLFINIDIIDSGGCRFLNIYVPYWVIPASSFIPLQFQHDVRTSSSVEKQYLNGIDGYAADQIFEGNETIKSKKNSGQNRNDESDEEKDSPLVKRQVSGVIGRARGKDGVILGPDVPLRGLVNILREEYDNRSFSHPLHVTVLKGDDSLESDSSRDSSLPNSPIKRHVPAEIKSHSNLSNVEHRKFPVVPLSRETSDLTLGSSPHQKQELPQLNHQIIPRSSSTSLYFTQPEINPSQADRFVSQSHLKFCFITQCSFSNGDKKSGRIRFRNQFTGWSHYISLDSTGNHFFTLESSGDPASSTSSSAIPSTSPLFKSGKKIFTFGLNIQPLEAPYQRTHVVTIVDRYVMINNLHQTLEIRQVKQESPLFTLQPSEFSKEEVPLWFRPDSPYHLQVRISAYGWLWSGSFAIEKEDEILLKLRNDYDDTVFFVMVIVNKKGPKTNILFHYGSPTSTPFHFENHTIETFRIQQLSTAPSSSYFSFSSSVKANSHTSTHLLPYHCCYYTWDEPLSVHKFSLSVLKIPFSQTSAKSSSLSADDWTDLGVFDFETFRDVLIPFSGKKTKKNSQGGRSLDHLTMKVVAMGPTRVFQIFDNRLQLQELEGNQQSTIPPTIRSSSLDQFPFLLSLLPRFKKSSILFELSLSMELFGISILDSTPEELLYLSSSGIKVTFQQEKKGHSINFIIQRMQVDNQLYVSPYPSLFHPLLPVFDIYSHNAEQLTVGGTINKTQITSVKPFIQVELKQSTEHSEVLYFPYFQFHLSPFDINLEGTIVMKLIHFTLHLLDLYNDTVGPYSPSFQSSELSVTESDCTGEGRNRNVGTELDIHDSLYYSSFNLSSSQSHYKLSLSQVQKVMSMVDLLYKHSQISTINSTAKGKSSHASSHQLTLSRIYVNKVLSQFNYLDQNSISKSSQKTGNQRQMEMKGKKGKKSKQKRREYEDDIPSPVGKKLYFQLFKISEIRFNISFNPLIAVDPFAQQIVSTSSSSSSNDSSSSSPVNIYNEITHLGLLFKFFNSILLAVGSALAKIENCPLRFTSYQLDHVFLSTKAFSTQVGTHYAVSAAKQSYLILFSSQILGNPVQLVQIISDGIYDFLYLPSSGFVTSPSAFVVGIFRGSKSLIKTVLASVCTSTSHLASSLQVGLLTLGVVEGYSFSNAFHSTVPLPTLTDVNPDSTSVGMTASTQSAVSSPPLPLSSSNKVGPRSWLFVNSLRPTNFRNGFKYGLLGLFLDPMVGYREDGVKGFFLGLWKGLIGSFSRPLYGFLGTATRVFDRISFFLLPRYLANQKAYLTRIRPPRFIKAKNLPLPVYYENENIGQELLCRRIANGIYYSESYIYHTNAITTNLKEGNEISREESLILYDEGNRKEKETLLLSKHYFFLLENHFEYTKILFQCLIERIVSIQISNSPFPKKMLVENSKTKDVYQKTMDFIQSGSKDKRIETTAFPSQLSGQPIVVISCQISDVTASASCNSDINRKR
jgi:hypothetical protein